jgi:hypothetical protein
MVFNMENMLLLPADKILQFGNEKKAPNRKLNFNPSPTSAEDATHIGGSQ